MKFLKLPSFTIGKGEPLALLSGPCVIEGEEHAMKTAEELKAICLKAGVNLVYKSSYDKANRSSYTGFRGPGLEEGLRILQKVKETFELPVVSDIHSEEEARAAAQVCDILQIPAFLCRQTDLLVAAARTGAAVSVKKGQFLAPWDMKNVVEKILHAGNDRILLTERGTCFGYNNLVSDMRSIPIMQTLGFPVCFDATHSVQLPGGRGTSSGGERQFIPILAKAAIAAGCDCLFMESHPDPSKAKSDKDSVVSLKELPVLLEQLRELYELVQQQKSLCFDPI